MQRGLVRWGGSLQRPRERRLHRVEGKIVGVSHSIGCCRHAAQSTSHVSAVVPPPPPPYSAATPSLTSERSNAKGRGSSELAVDRRKLWSPSPAGHEWVGGCHALLILLALRCCHDRPAEGIKEGTPRSGPRAFGAASSLDVSGRDSLSPNFLYRPLI